MFAIHSLTSLLNCLESSDPSPSLARRSAVAGFAPSPYRSNPASATGTPDASLKRGHVSVTPRGRGRSTTSYESFLQTAQQAQNLGSSTGTLASSPLISEGSICGFYPTGSMAQSPNSVATAQSTTTIDSGNSFQVTMPTLPVASTAGKPSKTPKRLLSSSAARAKSQSARRLNDSLVYLDGPGIYCCGECGTHLTSRDDIISKSFHGHHGRAFLLESCVNVKIGQAVKRRLLTGLHSVCDISCQRCDTLVGWTYQRAYELSQKYKEGKFIVEKIFLHLEEGDELDTSLGGSRCGVGSSWQSRSSMSSFSSSNKWTGRHPARNRLDAPRSSTGSSGQDEEKMVYEYGLP